MPSRGWGWRPHEQTHFCQERQIGTWDMPAILQMPSRWTFGSCGNPMQISNGDPALEVIISDNADFGAHRNIIQRLHNLS